MPDELTTVRVSVNEPLADDLQVERITQLLREELLGLDVEDVRPAVAGTAPAGAKGIELMQLGGLLVTLVKSGQVLSQIAEVVRSWARRDSNLQITLEVGDAKLSVTGASAAERDKLIDAWVTHALAQPTAAPDDATSDGDG